MDITASVPDTAPYFDKAVLNLGNVLVNNASATGVSGVDEAAYAGDVSGEETLSALDASLVAQVASGAGTGFSAFKDLDPAIIASVSGDSLPCALDASLINQAGAGASISQIPSIPLAVSPPTGGPDPYLYLSSVQASPGQTAVVTLYLDVTDPNGIQLAALDEAIGFDSGELQVSNIRGLLALAASNDFSTIGTADNQTGVLIVGQAFAGSGLPPMLSFGTDVPVLQFDVSVNADAPVGSLATLTLLHDGTVNGQDKVTAISDNDGALTLTPGMVPTNAGNPAIDGTLTVMAAQPPVTSAPVVTPVTLPPSHVLVPRVIQPVKRIEPLNTTPGNQTIDARDRRCGNFGGIGNAAYGGCHR